MKKIGFIILILTLTLNLSAQDSIVVVNNCIETTTVKIGNRTEKIMRFLDCYWDVGSDTSVVINDCIQRTTIQKNGIEKSSTIYLDCFWDDAQITDDTLLIANGDNSWRLYSRRIWEKEGQEKSLVVDDILHAYEAYRLGLYEVSQKRIKPDAALLVNLNLILNNPEVIINIRDTTINKAEVLKAVNALRTNGCNCGDKTMNSVPILKWNNELEKTAFAHAKDMFVRSYFSHDSPENEDHGDRLRRQGFQASSGENIAKGQAKGVDAYKAWEKSPGHCHNMMNPAYIYIGVARYLDRFCMVLSGELYTYDKK